MHGVRTSWFLYGACIMALLAVGLALTDVVRPLQRDYQTLIEDTIVIAISSLVLAVIYYRRREGNRRFLALIPAIVVASCLASAARYWSVA